MSKTKFMDMEKLNILGTMRDDENIVVEQPDDRENSPMH